MTRIRNLGLALTLCSVLLPAGIGAQEAIPVTTTAADGSLWPASFGETTRVNVVNVEVMVTDKDGKPVRGLDRDTFQVLEDGQPVEISNFFTVDGGESQSLTTASGTAPTAPEEAFPPVAPKPQEERKLHLIVYVDNINLAEVSRSRAFARLREFLVENWRENAEVMLVSNERQLVVRHGFTPVPHDIFAALAEMEKVVSQSARFDVDRRALIRAIELIPIEEGSGLFGTKQREGSGGSDLDSSGGNNRGGSQEELTEEVTRSAQAIKPQIRAFAQQRYKAVLDSLRTLARFVDLAAGLPGRKSIIYVSDGLSLRPGQAIWEAFANRFQVLGELGATTNPEAESRSTDATPAFQQLVRHANAQQVTFYTVDASLPAASQRNAAESQGSVGNFASWADSMATTEERNSEESLILMAEGTGGRYGLSNAAFASTLEGIFTDFDNFYSLGYVADPVPDGQDRRIKVKLKDPKSPYRVRYRHSFRDKSLLEKAAESTRTALILDSFDNPLDVVLEAQTTVPTEAGDQFIVPLLVKVPLNKVILLPGEESHRAKVSLFLAVRDGQGRTSAVQHHLCPIQIPNAEMPGALANSGACGIRLQMRGGSQKIVVSVLDEIAAVKSTVNLALEVHAQVAHPADPSESTDPPLREAQRE
jgi:VWFA-related protein